MFEMKNKKDEFYLLDEKVIDAIPDLQKPGGPGQPIIEAGNLLHRLQESRKRIIAELSGCTGQDSAGLPTIKYDARADAELLLSGVAVETLKSSIEESHRSSLLRQLRAVGHAVGIAEGRPAQLECIIIPQESQKLSDIAQGIVRDVLEAAQHLLICLETQKQFCQLLERNGFREPMRPTWMRVWPQESSWLAGDNNRPPLQRFIKDKSEAAGIKIEKL